MQLHIKTYINAIILNFSLYTSISVFTFFVNWKQKKNMHFAAVRKFVLQSAVSVWPHPSKAAGIAVFDTFPGGEG